MIHQISPTLCLKQVGVGRHTHREKKEARVRSRYQTPLSLPNAKPELKSVRDREITHELPTPTDNSLTVNIPTPLNKIQHAHTVRRVTSSRRLAAYSGTDCTSACVLLSLRNRLVSSFIQSLSLSALFLNKEAYVRIKKRSSVCHYRTLSRLRIEAIGINNMRN